MHSIHFGSYLIAKFDCFCDIQSVAATDRGKIFRRQMGPWQIVAREMSRRMHPVVDEGLLSSLLKDPIGKDFGEYFMGFKESFSEQLSRM